MIYISYFYRNSTVQVIVQVVLDISIDKRPSSSQAISPRQPTYNKWRWFMGKVWPVCG